jgi:peptide/nickel transport system substrate-binding protein
MPRGTTNADIDRRDLMKYLGAGGAAALAGCGGDGGDGGGDQTTTEEDDPDGTTTQSEGPVMGGRMTIGTRSEARSLNPLKVGDGATSDRVYKMMDGGLGLEAEGEISPYWFESWELADSLDKVTIKLRENLDFGTYEGTDYGQITADTYLENITELFRGWYPYTYSYNYYVAGQPIRYEKTGEYTFTAELPEPQPFYLYVSGVKYALVVPEQIISQYAENENASGIDQDPAIVNAGFTGNLGPWDLNKWNRQSIIVYDRADEWYLRDADMQDFAQGPQEEDYTNAPYFDQHALQVFNADNTQRQALRTGQIQYSSIGATRVDSFYNDDNIRVTENPFVSYSGYTGINNRANGWTQMRNQEVRHAFANLFDRNFVVENIMDGRGGVQGTLHPSWGPYYPPEDRLQSFEWTVDRAKTLLEQGTSSDYGYSGDTFVGPDGEQVELKCVYVAGTQDDLRAEYIKSRFAEAGIQVNLETTGWAPLLINYFYTNNPAEGYETGEIGYGDDNSNNISIYNWGPQDRAVASQPWDLMLTLGFSYGPYDPAGTISALYARQGSFNAYGFEGTMNYQQAAQEARSNTNRDEAVATMTDMLSTLSQDQPSIFESNPIGFNGWWKTVRGQAAGDDDTLDSYFDGSEYEQMYFANGVANE